MLSCRIRLILRIMLVPMAMVIISIITRLATLLRLLSNNIPRLIPFQGIRTIAQPTFTAPISATVITFQLIVNDGQINSSPATVSVTVGNVSTNNLAPLATATASSQNTSTTQTANKANDGVIDGYPGDYT